MIDLVIQWASSPFVDPALLVALGLLALFFLSLFWRCIVKSRSGTTNANCALGLAFQFFGAFLGVTTGILALALGPGQHRLIVTAFGSVALLCLSGAGLFFAARGLSEFSASGTSLETGRGRGVAAVWLALLLTASAGGGLSLAVARLAPAGARASKPSHSLTLSFKELNFEFLKPDAIWTEADLSFLSKDCKLTYVRQSPAVTFSLVAGKWAMGQSVSTRRLADLHKNQLESISEKLSVIEDIPYTVGGLPGILVEYQRATPERAFYSMEWYCSTNGYYYFLRGSGRFSEAAEVRSCLAGTFSHFHAIDVGRLAPAPGRTWFSDFISKPFNYSVAVSNSDWRVAPELAKAVPLAEFTAANHDCCLEVIPIPLGVEIEPEALAAGLLFTFQFSYPSPQLLNRKVVKSGGFAGLQFDFNRDIQGQRVHYRVRAVQANKNGYVLAAWTPEQGTSAGVSLDAALDLVKAGPPEDAATPTYSSGPRSRTKAAVLNQSALFFFNSAGYEKALPLFKAAFEANPAEPLYLQNTLETWRHLDSPAQALLFLNKQPAEWLSRPEFRAWQAYYQSQTTLSSVALENYASLFAGGFRSELHFGRYIQLLHAQRRFNKALEEEQKYLKVGDSEAVQALQAETYRLKGDLAAATDLLHRLHRKSPLNQQHVASLGEVLLASGSYGEAAVLSQEMLKADSESAYAHFLAGRSALGLKHFPEAKTAFAAAARLAPANKEIQTYLEHANGLLGQGDNTRVREPIEPVPLPAELTNSPPPLAGQEVTRGFGAYYARRIVAVSWVPKDHQTTTEYILARMLDDSGVAAFNTIQIPFDPFGEEIFVNELKVKDAAGNTLSTGKVDDYYVLDERSSSAASQRKVLTLPVAGLQPGCSLSLVLTWRSFGPLDQFIYQEHCFSRQIPVLESSFYLEGDASQLRFLSSPGLKRETIGHGCVWRVREPLVARWEPLQPPASEFLPTLWITDPAARWETISSNYLWSIQDRFAPTNEVTKRSGEITAGLQTDAAKAIALARFVQTNCTYKAIEFGRRARIPNPANDVLNNHYGDCKDHALLLLQMLKAAGVKASLVLAGHRGPLRQEAPSLDQFDHMLVYASCVSNCPFLDCTDKGADVGNLPPQGLAGQDVLVLDPNSPRFITVPVLSTNDASVTIRRKLTVLAPSEMQVEETVTLSGCEAAFFRKLLLETAPAMRGLTFQRFTGTSEIELSRFELEGLEELRQPLVARLAFTLTDQLHAADGRLSGTLPAMLEKWLLSLQPVEHRFSPFVLGLPLAIHSEVLVEGPAGFTTELPETRDLRLDPRFANGTLHLARAVNGFQLNFDFQQKTGKFDAPAYAACRQSFAQAIAALNCELVFRQALHHPARDN